MNPAVRVQVADTLDAHQRELRHRMESRLQGMGFDPERSFSLLQDALVQTLQCLSESLRMPQEELPARMLARHRALGKQGLSPGEALLLYDILAATSRDLIRDVARPEEQGSFGQFLDVLWQQELRTLVQSCTLQVTERIAQGFLNALPYAVAVVDRNLCIYLANKHLATLVECPFERLQGQALLDLLPLPCLVEVAEDLEQQEEFPSWTVVERRERISLPGLGDRGLHLVLARLPVLDDPDTERQVPWAALLLEVEPDQDYQRQLFQADKLAAVGQLVAGVAHELNNPLTGIMGYSQLLLRDSHEDNEARHQLERIHGAAQRAAHIVKQLLTFARQHAPEQRPVGINGLLGSVLDLVGHQLQLDNIPVECHLAPDEEIPKVLGDYHRLQQVFLSFVINAHQAMAETGKPGALTVKTDCFGKRVRVTIADTGPGIPPTALGRIFDPFFTTKPPGKGTGLGLSVAYGIVRDHGGTLRVESTPGNGARFTVELPVADQSEHVQDEGADAGSKELGGGCRILVVDDEECILDVCFHALLGMGCRPDLARSGRMALQKLEQGVYDLIILDLHLPDLDGRTLYRDIVRRWPGRACRVLFTTGDTLSAHIQAFLDESGRPCLAKPFGIGELQNAVREGLQAAEQGDVSGDP